MAKQAKQANPREEKLIDFRKIGAIIKKNWIVMTRDKTRLIPLLAFPLVMIMVLGYTTGNTPKHIAAALVVYDNSPFSQEIQQQITGSEYFSVAHVVSTEGEARRLLDSGIVRVIIEIPPDLKANIDTGTQAAITVIVDESDSSIAATSKQVLTGIVDGLSNQLSTQRLVGFQQSVGASAASIAQYASSQQNSYGEIATLTAAATGKLTVAKNILDKDKNALASSVSQPTIIQFHILTLTNSTTSSGNTILEPAPGSDAASAQVGVLSQSSYLLGSGLSDLNAATAAAAQADKQAQALQGPAYQENVAKPLAAIAVFTRSRTDNILTPLIYVEKPAYGTGRQPIDFLIPSIIALTLFQGAVMGMGRAVAGEKRDGSLTRVFLTPTSNTTIIFGTLLFYVLFEMMRATFLLTFAMVLFNIKIEGSLLLIALIVLIYVATSAAIGMIMSTLVKTEQQFMAMAMLISLPATFLSGVFFPLQAMPKLMQSISRVIPVTYAADALRGVMIKGFSFGPIAGSLGILLLFTVLAIGAVLVLFKRNIE